MYCTVPLSIWKPHTKKKEAKWSKTQQVEMWLKDWQTQMDIYWVVGAAGGFTPPPPRTTGGNLRLVTVSQWQVPNIFRKNIYCVYCTACCYQIDDKKARLRDRLVWWKDGKTVGWQDGSGRMEVWHDGRTAGWQNDRTAGWQNGRMAQDGRMAEWQDGTGRQDGRMAGWHRMAGCQDVRMAGWQDGRIAGWQDGRMAGGWQECQSTSVSILQRRHGDLVQSFRYC